MERGRLPEGETWSSDYVDLSSRFIPDSVLARLYLENPRLPHTSRDGCPTCDGARSYTMAGKTFDCDCDQQLTLHKHYLAANIGLAHQRLSWEDYVGDPDALQLLVWWLRQHGGMVTQGMGAVLRGEFGLGKTMLAVLTGKELVKLGYDVFFVTFSGMVQMFTAGWNSDQDRRAYEARVIRSDILVLDDLGKEFVTKNNLGLSTLDHCLRQRLAAARPTIVTTNHDDEQLSVIYGPGMASLLKERAMQVHFTGADFRDKTVDKTTAEVAVRSIRPIT